MVVPTPLNPPWRAGGKEAPLVSGRTGSSRSRVYPRPSAPATVRVGVLVSTCMGSMVEGVASIFFCLFPVFIYLFFLVESHRHCTVYSKGF